MMSSSFKTTDKQMNQPLNPKKGFSGLLYKMFYMM